MFGRVEQNTSAKYDCGNINKIKVDPSEILHEELIFKIFSDLNLAALGTCCSVSKAWKQLADRPILWKNVIYREVAFGNDKWAQCFGSDVVKCEDSREEFSSLPWKDFIDDCKKFQSVFPERKAKDTLMLVRLPKTLNGGLTLKSLGELAKKYFSDTSIGYRCMWSDITAEFGDKSISKSYWVLMTKDVLPGSRQKFYTKHKKIIDELAEEELVDYEAPKVLEAVACIFSQYFDAKTRLFNDTYTFCKESVSEHQLVVGNFSQEGLGVAGRNYFDFSVGIAALKKFKKVIEPDGLYVL